MIRSLIFLTGVWLVLGGCSAKDGNAAADAEAGTSKEVQADAKKDKGKITEPAVDTSGFTAAPAWTMSDLNGGTLTNADLAGKVVLVDFWATWCGPCKMAIPHLKELYAEYQDAGFEIVGVSLDRQGASIVKPFVTQAAITYPMVIGNMKVVQDFGGVSGIPTAFIITQDGKIYKKYVGFQPKQVYERDIRALLGIQAG